MTYGRAVYNRNRYNQPKEAATTPSDPGGPVTPSPTLDPRKYRRATILAGNLNQGDSAFVARRRRDLIYQPTDIMGRIEMAPAIQSQAGAKAPVEAPEPNKPPYIVRP